MTLTLWVPQADYIATENVIHHHGLIRLGRQDPVHLSNCMGLGTRRRGGSIQIDLHGSIKENSFSAVKIQLNFHALKYGIHLLLYYNDNFLLITFLFLIFETMLRDHLADSKVLPVS